MPVKKYKPVTPGQRGMTGHTFEEITKSKPERSLLLPLRKQGGRNVHGRVTVRHRGGGHRRFIRIVDFKRDKRNIPAKVAAIEYDPDDTLFTQRCTTEAVAFIRKNRARPFFLYLAHPQVHKEVLASPAFSGRTARGADHSRSNTAAMPWPPPMHIVTSA